MRSGGDESLTAELLRAWRSGMKIEEVLLNLGSFDQEATIFATEPWTRRSDAVVDFPPDDHSLPESAIAAGADYFLEVSIALECLNGWIRHLKYTPSSDEICDRLIYYARYDA
jgi:hypothetical protein